MNIDRDVLKVLNETPELGDAGSAGKISVDSDYAEPPHFHASGHKYKFWLPYIAVVDKPFKEAIKLTKAIISGDFVKLKMAVDKDYPKNICLDVAKWLQSFSSDKKYGKMSNFLRVVLAWNRNYEAKGMPYTYENCKDQTKN